MEVLVKCICSQNYIEMFQWNECENFLLTCPTYWIDYRGPHREEMANMLLDSLLRSIVDILQQKYTKQRQKPLILLVNLLSYSLRLCATSIFESDHLMNMIDGLLLILNEQVLLEENRPIVKIVLELSVNEEETISQRTVPTTLSFQTVIVSNENINKEEIVLIWYDKNIGIYNGTKKTIELLQQINDYVSICSNRETCIEYIRQIQTEKIFVILSGLSADDILDEIHDYQQIDSIFIFCMKREKYEIYLNNNKYYKVVGIYTKHESLLTALQENIRYLIKQTEAAGLFDQDERSMRNLNRELYTFHCFFAFKQVLLKTDYNSDAAKREMIEICRNYYRNNKKELKNIDEFERTYQSEDAIYWYTKQTFIYRLVNKALRTEDYEAMLVLRFFIVDLCENLRQKYEELK
ncbi:unnamed protein product [Rotaria sp. Silwood2]|nr:unnamed protein product [Rotaria sp. Silwood2]